MCIVFWGTGISGHSMLKYWKKFGLKPDCFCDNNREKWGKTIDGIPIICPDTLREKDELFIVITCCAVKAVTEQINSMNLKNAEIMDGSSQCSSDMNIFLYERIKKTPIIKTKEINKNTLVMDFQYGTVLGGVQTWCYSQAEILRDMGIKGYYLMPDNYTADTPYNFFDSCIVAPNELTEADNYLDAYINKLIGISPEFVIACFPQEIFTAAVMVKRRYIPNLKIIAVIHNDEEIYYERYTKLSEYIDKCVVISDKMKKRLISCGFNPEKIEKIMWKIPLADITDRTYSPNKLKIGYAGRIVKHQKRIELIIELAERLNEKNVEYTIDIAGIGEDEDFLSKAIAENGLENSINMVGLIAHEKIYDFWKAHDIYLSCSDFEGHSISQYEAMSCGAVPVVTDVSGAEDDITNGINGFIADIGDVEKLSEYIEYIYRHKEVLPLMAQKTKVIFEERDKALDERKLWNKIMNG